MALILKQPGAQPLGQFDGVDSITTSVKGGEVGTFTSVSIASDEAADDVDGYIPGGTVRPAITTNLPSTLAAPLGLIDDGSAPDYGTLFGSVLGANVGKSSFGPGSTGTALGPHTAAASGKLTLWTKPGTYAATLDAVDTTLNSGLVPSNASLSIGDALYAQASFGLLTPNTTSVVQSGGSDVVVARFISFETNGSLVTTPVSLASAANSPVGQPASGQATSYDQVVFEFNPPLA